MNINMSIFSKHMLYVCVQYTNIYYVNKNCILDAIKVRVNRKLLPTLFQCSDVFPAEIEY